jgi:hypothetical protein
MKFFQKIILYSRDLLAVFVLLVFYHGYELLCYVTGNLFQYYIAVAICTGVLFLTSLGLVYLHDFFLAHFAWDALKLQYINQLTEVDHIPSYQIFRRLTGLVLREGFWAVLVVGPVILGPFITTLLLRKRQTWRINVLYTGSGAFFNALFWVALMRGIGVLTWGFISDLLGQTLK